MLVAILGTIDVVAGLILFFGRVISIPTNFLVLLGFILLAKSSLGMFKDFGSWIDLSSGIIILFSIISHIHLFFKIIIGLLIFQKGAASLLYTPP